MPWKRADAANEDSRPFYLPFFWSGYLLVNCGQKPDVAEEDDVPVVKEKEEVPAPAKPLKLKNRPARAHPHLPEGEGPGRPLSGKWQKPNQ